MLKPLATLLLTDDRRQRIRLQQAGFALLLMIASVACLHLAVAVGAAPASPWVFAWSATCVVGFVIVGLLIRTGATRDLADPSLTVVQMVHAIACAAWGYALSGEAHPMAPLMLAVILMFGMFGMSTRQVMGVAVYAAAVFGAVVAWMPMRDPANFHAAPDGVQYLVTLIMLTGVVILTRLLHQFRDRLRERKEALEVAVAHIQRLATHDELTGLINRRHMQELLEAERLRSQRDRHTWCAALIDIDHFKRINDQHGHACGDEVLRALGQRAVALIRKTDSLGRWGGEEFVLLMPNTPLAAAHNSLDRLREHFHQHPLSIGSISLSLSFSAGVTEHRFGETVAQTLERADKLAYQAKTLGRNRVEQG